MPKIQTPWCAFESHRTPPKCDMIFRSDAQVEYEHTQDMPANTDTIDKLIKQHGVSFSFMCGGINPIASRSRSDIACASLRNRIFQSFRNELAFKETDRMGWHWRNHPLKPLILTKQSLWHESLNVLYSLRTIWPENKAEDFRELFRRSRRRRRFVYSWNT